MKSQLLVLRGGALVENCRFSN